MGQLLEDAPDPRQAPSPGQLDSGFGVGASDGDRASDLQPEAGSSDLMFQCPGDDRCICREWRAAAEIGIRNGVFFDTLRLVGSDTWRATGVAADDKRPIIGESRIGPADALRELRRAILQDRMERHDG